VIDALHRADVFFLPSVAEVLPVSLMEAQAVGLPVVATSVGAVGEVVLDGRSGVLAAPGDPDALADMLGSLIQRSREWVLMGLTGRRHVEANFDVNRLNDRLVEIYGRVQAGEFMRSPRDAAPSVPRTT
jgi:colanic acid/amylovoran biosynthesis glycosyltransferase